MTVYTVLFTPSVPELLGEAPKYSEGTVSSLTGIADEASLMQISVPLQPGNSGGPLLNEAGSVVGMTISGAGVEYFYMSTGTLPQNVNWAIKSEFILPLLPSVLSEQPAASDTTRDDVVERVKRAVCLLRASR
jgi:S1-C subfamily serine protease